MEKVFCVGDGAMGREWWPRVEPLLEVMEAKVCMGRRGGEGGGQWGGTGSPGGTAACVWGGRGGTQSLYQRDVVRDWYH